MTSLSAFSNFQVDYVFGISTCMPFYSCHYRDYIIKTDNVLYPFLK